MTSDTKAISATNIAMQRLCTSLTAAGEAARTMTRAIDHLSATSAAASASLEGEVIPPIRSTIIKAKHPLMVDVEVTPGSNPMKDITPRSI